MGAQLDLDDVVHGHPLAIIELANLRAKVKRLELLVLDHVEQLEEPDAGYTQTPEGRAYIAKLRAALVEP